jgi:hypothetical protein
MSDELHKAVAFEDCDSYELFSPADRFVSISIIYCSTDQCFLLSISILRQEFIFRVLKHLVIGGGMCQVPHSFHYSNFVRSLLMSTRSLKTSGSPTLTQFLPCQHFISRQNRQFLMTVYQVQRHCRSAEERCDQANSSHVHRV